MSSILRFIGRHPISIGTLIGGSALVAYPYLYRPLPTLEPIPPAQNVIKPELYNLSQRSDEKDPFFIRIWRSIIVASVKFFVAAISKVYLGQLNNLQIVEDDRYDFFVQAVSNRPAGLPLITVSNHCSTVDDPSIFCCLLPWRNALRADLARWTICSQEYCFKTPLEASFFGAGKVMPISRGGGIDQPALLDFARRAASGGWIHIFPEGKIVQSGHLGGRADPEVDNKGLLKWGVGKLIAHCPTPPVVLPFYHYGMQDVIPQFEHNNEVKSVIPEVGQNITLRVGRPIVYQDLIDEYERKHGPIRKYKANANADMGKTLAEVWVSTPAEKELYHKITSRIEEAMLTLDREQHEWMARNQQQN